MSEQVATVQSIYAAFGTGDIAAILDRLAENVDWEHDWAVMPHRFFAPRHGRAEVVGFFESLGELEFLQFEPLNLLEGDNQVAALIRIAVKVKRTGRVVEDLEIHLWTFGPDGKIAALRHFGDTRQMAEALI
jgi:uncharacterized protein